MKELYNELNELIQSIDQTTERFYQQHTQDGYSKLDQTLIQLMNTMEDISNYKMEHKTDQKVINIDEDNINQILNTALNALQEKDTILFSDILQYELKESLIGIMNTL